MQPGTRLLWTPDNKQTVWASVSRAVRTPAQINVDLRQNKDVFPPGYLYPNSPLAMVSLFGNPGFVSEDLVAYELGYRVSPSPKFSVDIASFYNVYDHLQTMEPVSLPKTQPQPDYLTLPYVFSNLMHGDTYGMEIASSWQVSERLAT